MTEVGAPLEWVNLDGVNDYSRFQISARAMFDSQVLPLRLASNHAFEKGLGTGIPNFEAARRATNFFKRNDSHKEA